MQLLAMTAPSTETYTLTDLVVRRQLDASGLSVSTEFWPDLKTLQTTQLVQRAQNLGLPASTIEGAEDSDNAKAALVDLIMEHEMSVPDASIDSHSSWEVKIWLCPFHRRTAADTVKVRIAVPNRSTCLGLCSIEIGLTLSGAPVCLERNEGCRYGRSSFATPSRKFSFCPHRSEIYFA